MTARGAKLGRCVGVCFDAEPYGANPWHYPAQPHAETKTFAEYRSKYRERGAQFMDAIQGQMPKVVVHTFFVFSFLQRLWDIEDVAEREQRLSQEHYGLYPAFINGMLDAAGPGVTLTDGNEGAYYYQGTLPFYQAYHGIRQRARSMAAPENDLTYRAQVQVAQALYVDHLFNLRARKYLSAYMTPEERAQWFEHNVYYALTTTDKYVWLYSEKMNWWLNRDIPPGLEDAVKSAREKVREHQGLGFEIDPAIEAAREREQEEIRKALISRSADIAKLTAAALTIDGDLSDEAWTEAQPLEPFLPYVTAQSQEIQPTEARVTYDAEKLYVAVRCLEPNVGGMKIVGKNRDDSVWLGDSVDIFVEPADRAPTYYHFIINPENVVWDATATDKDQDLKYNPAWSTATKIGESEWTVEVAIPWAEMNTSAPAAGSACRANICRQRIQGREWGTWSQVVGGFVEPKSFGTWTFR